MGSKTLSAHLGTSFSFASFFFLRGWIKFFNFTTDISLKDRTLYQKKERKKIGKQIKKKGG